MKSSSLRLPELFYGSADAGRSPSESSSSDDEWAYQATRELDAARFAAAAAQQAAAAAAYTRAVAAKRAPKDPFELTSDEESSDDAALRAKRRQRAAPGGRRNLPNPKRPASTAVADPPRRVRWSSKLIASYIDLADLLCHPVSQAAVTPLSLGTSKLLQPYRWKALKA